MGQSSTLTAIIRGLKGNSTPPIITLTGRDYHLNLALIGSDLREAGAWRRPGRICPTYVKLRCCSVYSELTLLYPSLTIAPLRSPTRPKEIRWGTAFGVSKTIGSREGPCRKTGPFSLPAARFDFHGQPCSRLSQCHVETRMIDRAIATSLNYQLERRLSIRDPNLEPERREPARLLNCGTGAWGMQLLRRPTG